MVHQRRPPNWFFYICLIACLAILPGAAQKDRGNSGKGGGKGAQTRFKGLDRNNDGRISRDEWRGNDRSFSVHDTNGDGVIAGAEVGEALQAENYDDFLDIDRNRDGRISRDEWRWDRDEFDRMDDDHEGSLTRREYMATTGDGPDSRFPDSRQRRPDALTSPATPVPEDLPARFSRFDRDGNGRISRDEWDSERKSFDALDENNDGALSRDEFLNASPEARDAMFRRHDLDGNGVISRTEWKGDKQSFARLDTNDDGKLKHEEFSKRYRKLEKNFRGMDRDNNGWLSRQEWRGDKKAFDNLDDNQDNQVSFTEFVGVN